MVGTAGAPVQTGMVQNAARIIDKQPESGHTPATLPGRAGSAGTGTPGGRIFWLVCILTLSVLEFLIMAKTVAIQAQLRGAAGKGAARRDRRAGNVLGVIYGNNETPVSISMNERAFMKVLDSHFFTHLFEVTVDGVTHTTVARDLQVHPVTDRPLHVDFLRVTGDAVVTVNVPVEFVGQDKSPGIKRGGVLNIVRHEVELRTLWNNIPDKLTVDLSAANVGDSIHISAIKLPKGATPVITDRDFTVATLAAPSAGVEASA